MELGVEELDFYKFIKVVLLNLVVTPSSEYHENNTRFCFTKV